MIGASKTQTDTKQLQFLYDWMRIARKPGQTFKEDIRLIFKLISIPISDSEINILEKIINPFGTKYQLSKVDLLRCFTVQEQNKKIREKELIKAFKYITKDQDDISFQELKSLMQAQEIDSMTAQVVLKQLCQYENANGKFDYRKFVASLH